MDPQDDPEARIRELERSLSDAAGKSELTAAERGGGYDKYSASPTTRTTAGFRGAKTGTVGGPDLMWTQNKDLLLGDIQGPDLNALYQFWQDL